MLFKIHTYVDDDEQWYVVQAYDEVDALDKLGFGVDDYHMEQISCDDVICIPQEIYDDLTMLNGRKE